MGARVELHGHDPGSPHTQPELFEFSFEEEPGGGRPDSLLEVQPQERVQRHTVEKITADGGTAAGRCRRAARYPGPRAGYRSAQDPHRRALIANDGSRAAAGGTAGDRVSH